MKRRSRWFLFLCGFLPSLALASSESMACRINRPITAEQIRSADMIFRGTLTQMTVHRGEAILIFSVAHTYVGERQSQRTVRMKIGWPLGPEISSRDTFQTNFGSDVIVVVHETGDIIQNICGGTAVVSWTDQDMRNVRETGIVTGLPGH